MSLDIRPPRRLDRSQLPTHLDLPFRDDEVSENFHEYPQVALFEQAARPVFEARHPGRRFCMGGNNFIYWRITDPPTDGCKSPDWFYIPGVPPDKLDDGESRRSYVLWQELVPPLVVAEFASRDGTEERDATPGTGKFWVYEQGIKARYYILWVLQTETLEVYERRGGRYRRVQPDRHGLLPMKAAGLSVGVWEGTVQGYEGPWARLYTLEGKLLPTLGERSAADRRATRAARRRTRAYRQRAEAIQGQLEGERQRAESERQRAEAVQAERDRLAAKLRALGIDPDA